MDKTGLLHFSATALIGQKDYPSGKFIEWAARQDRRR